MKMIKKKAACANNGIRRLLLTVVTCVLLFISGEALAVTVIITNTADTVVDVEYDSNLCSVLVNELNLNEEGLRRFVISVNINEGYHKHGFTLTTTTGTIEKTGENEYILTVRGGEQPEIKVIGIDQDPYATVRIFERNGAGTVVSRDSACETLFYFGAIRPDEFQSAGIVAEPALPSGTEVTMKTGGKWYVYRVSEAVNTIDLTSFSAADGSGRYSLPQGSEQCELSFLIRLDFSECGTLPEPGYASISMVLNQKAEAETAEEASDTGESHAVMEDDDNDALSALPRDDAVLPEETDIIPNGLKSTLPETETVDAKGNANIALVRETQYRIGTDRPEGSVVRILLSKTPSAGADITHDKLAEALVFVPGVKLPDSAVLVVGKFAYRYTDGCFLVPLASDTPDEISVRFEKGSVPPGKYRFVVRRMLSRTSIPEACLNGVQTAAAEFQITVQENLSGSVSSDSAEPEDNASDSLR